MDIATRAEAAKLRLLAGKQEMAEALSAGRPCTQCAYFTTGHGLLDGHCGHLAYTRPSYDPVSGEVRQTIEVPARTARGEGGLCGPEGLLFETRRYAIARRHLANLDLYAGLFGLWLASGLFFWAVLWPLLVG